MKKDKKFKQLLVISTRRNQIMFPVCFILLNSKNKLSYDIVFSFLKTILTFTKESISVVVDYEVGLIKSIETNFPNFQINTCLFHLKTNLIKNYFKDLSKINKNRELKYPSVKVISNLFDKILYNDNKSDDEHKIFFENIINQLNL